MKIDTRGNRTLFGDRHFSEQVHRGCGEGQISRRTGSHNGNQWQASRLLGIHRNTLQRKMVAYVCPAHTRGFGARRKPAAARGMSKGRKSRRGLMTLLISIWTYPDRFQLAWLTPFNALALT